MFFRADEFFQYVYVCVQLVKLVQKRKDDWHSVLLVLLAISLGIARLHTRWLERQTTDEHAHDE